MANEVGEKLIDKIVMQTSYEKIDDRTFYLLSDFEKEILARKYSGETDSKISNDFGISKQRVNGLYQSEVRKKLWQMILIKSGETIPVEDYKKFFKSCDQNAAYEAEYIESMIRDKFSIKGLEGKILESGLSKGIIKINEKNEKSKEILTEHRENTKDYGTKLRRAIAELYGKGNETLLGLPIGYLNPSGRTKNNAAFLEIYTIGELIICGKERLLATYGMGRKSLLELKDQLNELGLKLNKN